jgi:endonuclease III related protein
MTAPDSPPAAQTDTGRLLLTIYEKLYEHYGPQQWWPTHTGNIWEIMLGAVLTQRTLWTNVDLALDNMMAVWGPDSFTQPEVVLNAPMEALVAVLRPAGFHTSKPKRLKNLAAFVLDHGGAAALANSELPTDVLRKQLLDLSGVGPETADAILLYALNRPVFVADAYALRLAARWGLLPPTAGYHVIQALFMDNLEHDVWFFREYHALIVAHGKDICRPRARCEICPLGSVLHVVGDPQESTWMCPRKYVRNA